MFDVVIERVSECDHLHDWRKEHEEQRQRITQHNYKFFIQDGGKSAEWRFHADTWLSSRAVSVTNTSSSDGAIGRISMLRMPASSSARRKTSSVRVASANKCMD